MSYNKKLLIVFYPPAFLLMVGGWLGLTFMSNHTWSLLVALLCAGFGIFLFIIPAAYWETGAKHVE